jgi:hypothetical protein
MVKLSLSDLVLIFTVVCSERKLLLIDLYNKFIMIEKYYTISKPNRALVY